jgi:hypothetical protein
MKSKYTVVPVCLAVISFFLVISITVSAADQCPGDEKQWSYTTMDNAYAAFEACAEDKNYDTMHGVCDAAKDSRCAQLAFLYGQSLVKKQDDKVGVQWIFYAAANGNAAAQKQLGIMFSVGAGVSVNYIKAYSFLTWADSNGAEGTGDILNMLNAKLSPEMKQRAEKYLQALQARGQPNLADIGEFTDVLILTDAEKVILKKKVILCNLVADGVKAIAQERDKGVHSSESVQAGQKLVMAKLKKAPKNMPEYVEALLNRVTVLVYLAKEVKPETFRLYYFTQCVNSAVKDEKPVIELNSIHDVIAGLEKCQATPGVADATAFGICLRQHVLPYVAKKL